MNIIQQDIDHYQHLADAHRKLNNLHWAEEFDETVARMERRQRQMVMDAHPFEVQEEPS